MSRLIDGYLSFDGLVSGDTLGLCGRDRDVKCGKIDGRVEDRAVFEEDRERERKTLLCHPVGVGQCPTANRKPRRLRTSSEKDPAKSKTFSTLSANSGRSGIADLHV